MNKTIYESYFQSNSFVIIITDIVIIRHIYKKQTFSWKKCR